MPKQKTHKGAAKRFDLTKSGKVKRAQAFQAPYPHQEATKRTRNLRKAAYLTSTEGKTMKKLMPYK